VVRGNFMNRVGHRPHGPDKSSRWLLQMAHSRSASTFGERVGVALPGLLVLRSLGGSFRSIGDRDDASPIGIFSPVMRPGYPNVSRIRGGQHHFSDARDRVSGSKIFAQMQR